MPDASLTRRTLLGPLLGAVLALPLAVAACGEGEDAGSYPPLRYEYLPAITLNVASIEIEQLYVPSGQAPDVSALAPVPPVEALRAMAQDRLKAFGTAGRGVFAIQEASLVRRGDTVSGSMAVTLTMYAPGGAAAGFVEARVAREVSGSGGSRRSVLYGVVRAMMDQMNVELEYQIRRNLREWLVSATSSPAAVEQMPLDGSPGTVPQPMSPAPPPGAELRPQSMTPPPGTLSASPAQPDTLWPNPFPQAGPAPSYPPSVYPPANYPPATYRP
jgi:hypothetical protein